MGSFASKVLGCGVKVEPHICLLYYLSYVLFLSPPLFKKYHKHAHMHTHVVPPGLLLLGPEPADQLYFFPLCLHLNISCALQSLHGPLIPSLSVCSRFMIGCGAWLTGEGYRLWLLISMYCGRTTEVGVVKRQAQLLFLSRLLCLTLLSSFYSFSFHQSLQGIVSGMCYVG